ncbi:endonuclease III domain-containing protein [Bacillus cereus]
MLNKTQIRYCLDTMADMYPEAHCELVHDNPFELVIAVALSAQCTDVLVNKVTRNLFQKYKNTRRLFKCFSRRITTRYTLYRIV